MDDELDGIDPISFLDQVAAASNEMTSRVIPDISEKMNAHDVQSRDAENDPVAELANEFMVQIHEEFDTCSPCLHLAAKGPQPLFFFYADRPVRLYCSSCFEKQIDLRRYFPEEKCDLCHERDATASIVTNSHMLAVAVAVCARCSQENYEVP